ncbi:MAG: hypothetical protein K2I96_14225 [Lachnospiraceae bacterium]|nr:hypothetical protein [Lachnospiraceae bacterium]
MHQEQEDLDILFRRTMPEAVLKRIRSGSVLVKQKDSAAVGFDDYAVSAYDRYSLLNLSEYTATEVRLRKEALDDSVARMKLGGIFSALVLYADKVLRYNGETLVCRSEEMLNWRSIYLRLGQDIFTTALLAWHSCMSCSNLMRNRKMTWPAVLRTDDVRLDNILQRGLAENHFHLHGSTQSFALSWACLMNHPAMIHTHLNSESMFGKNLAYNASSGAADNVMDWQQRILYAAMIRALLFECCMGRFQDGRAAELQEQFAGFDVMPLATDVKEHTELLRQMYGSKFKQTDGRWVCLDYAICSRFYYVDAADHNRLLGGERCLLYQCFCRQFSGRATRAESDLLYLYLLIKSNFRGELIQVNGRRGFQNFLEYQNRKNQLFEQRAEYWTESLRLSVCSGIRENHLRSLEARIMPKKSKGAMYRAIKDLDGRIDFAEKELPYYYVVHFAKEPMGKPGHDDQGMAVRPRNHKVRRRIRQQAEALARYMRLSGRKGQRVWGVDACSMEIGCRPETFATEMRYLRVCSRMGVENPWYRKPDRFCEEIGITYHVGEDFLDIADGLRAVDEAIRFLCMEKGDRIGHGLVLGIDPEEYYQNKKNSIYLRKQDYLDNLVWILYRSLEFGIEIRENVRADMKNQAEKMLYEIYEKCISTLTTGNPLELYYRSWQLRGDHPDLYRTGQFWEQEQLSSRMYDNCKVPGGLKRYSTRYETLQPYRDNDDIAGLYSRYHFDDGVKSRGYRVIDFTVKKEYIDIMGAMQHAMRREIFEKGICVECNPTSNVLIGTFQTYKKHPILGFNKFHLEEDSRHMNLQVSLNTDDLGVFDTSLENEYALMLNVVRDKRHEEGNYNDDAVYEYLEYLRMNGINMAFRPLRL